MNYSAQAILLDSEHKVYLEDNLVIQALSFIGGRCEVGESYEDTILRELAEELWISLKIEELLEGQQQPTRSFWNERQQQYIDWTSKYFVVLLKEELDLTQMNIKLGKYSLSDLESLPDSKFPSQQKDQFIAQVQRALSHIVSLWN